MASMVRRKFFAVISALPFVGKLGALTVVDEPGWEKKAGWQSQHEICGKVESRVYHSFNGLEWAQEFVAHVKANPAIPLDVATMHTWFASALMRGYDERSWRHDAEVREAGITSTQELQKEAITGAVARGWCADVNRHKVMDSDLAFAIVDELMKLRA